MGLSEKELQAIEGRAKPSSPDPVGAVYACEDKACAVYEYAEAAETDRDELLSAYRELESERDAAQARIQELEEEVEELRPKTVMEQVEDVLGMKPPKGVK